jgi:cyd operon protein YbgT
MNASGAVIGRTLEHSFICKHLIGVAAIDPRNFATSTWNAPFFYMSSACSFAILNAMWFELNADAKARQEADSATHPE